MICMLRDINAISNGHLCIDIRIMIDVGQSDIAVHCHSGGSKADLVPSCIHISVVYFIANCNIRKVPVQATRER